MFHSAHRNFDRWGGVLFPKICSALCWTKLWCHHFCLFGNKQLVCLAQNPKDKLCVSLCWYVLFEIYYFLFFSYFLLKVSWYIILDKQLVNLIYNIILDVCLKPFKKVPQMKCLHILIYRVCCWTLTVFPGGIHIKGLPRSTSPKELC